MKPTRLSRRDSGASNIAYAPVRRLVDVRCKRVKYPLAMSWRASARHGVREAPAGLALVQDLLNTRATMTYGPDLLDMPDDAQRWLTEALVTWSRVAGLPAPVLLLSSTDLRSLRRLRTTFENVVLAGGRNTEPDGALPPADVPVSLVPDADGWVRIVPTGRGTRWLASALWAEALLAQQAGHVAAAQAVPQRRLPGRVLRHLAQQQRRLARRQHLR